MMKDFIFNNMEMIISTISFLVTYFFGLLAKKKKYIKSRLIPIQNILIMIVSIFIYYYSTNDFSLVVASGSPVATLIYDTFHLLLKEE